MPAARPTIDDVVAVLSRGPRHEDDLIDDLGLFEEDEDETWLLMEDLLDDDRIVELADGRLALGTALLEGVVAWHRVAPEEIASRTVAPGVDAVLHLALSPWPREVRIGDRAVAFEVWSGEEGPDPDRGPTLPLPEGWAPDLAAGDLVALVLDGDETCLVTATDPRAAADEGGPDVGGRLRDALAAVADDHGLVLSLLHDPDERVVDQWVLHLDEAVPLLMADHGPVLRDLGLPLGEALAESGLACVGGVVGGPAVSEAHLGLYALGRTLLGPRVDQDLDRPDIAEATGLAWSALVGGQTLDPQVAVAVDVALLVALNLPGAVEAIVDHLRSIDNDELDGLSTRVGQLQALDPEAPGPAWLAAEALLVRGEPGDALELLSTSVGRGASPPEGQWRAAWEALANLRAVSGDITGAISLFQRLSEPGVVRRLSQWRPVPPTGVGRNERCPCGSGRKFKQCCLIRPAPLDLDARVPALWWKLETWVIRYHRDHVPRPDVELLDPSMAGVWMWGNDAHLVEDGAMAEVVAEIGDLLPADERALVDQWLLRSHSLWEVGAVDSAGRCHLRDLVRSDAMTVISDLLEDEELGQLLLALVVQGADREHLVGLAARVPFEARDRAVEVLSGDPEGQDIVDFVTALLSPPAMTTPEGDAMVVHEGRWQVADLDAAMAALDQVSPRDSGELRWDAVAGTSVLWSLRVEGADLVGSTLSDERWDEMAAVVARALPDATLVDHQITDPAALLAAAGQAPGGLRSLIGDGPWSADDDPDLGDLTEDDIVREFIRDKEVEWCDESVPALGGITPRQAVADPTRRGDVIALLRSFRTPVTPALAGSGFDADRLAALLDLTDEL
ncbi:MAG: SEC-C metal-binding domain-containing protein [Iamia sp.]